MVKSLNCAQSGAQPAILFELKEIVGLATTTTFAVVEDEQLRFVPVTLYVVVALGETTKGLRLELVFQL